MISIITAVAAFALIPFGDAQHIFGTRVGLYGVDISIGPLYVFAFGAIAFYGLMLGGWASGSKYSFLGAMRGRRAADLLRGLAGARAARRRHHRRHALADRDRPRAGRHVVLHPAVRRLPRLHVASFAETNRSPFDLIEADAELVAGYFTEYGGTRWSRSCFAEYLNMMVVSGIVVTLFLGGWLLPFGIHPPAWVDPFVVLREDGR